tara:strand:+ start:1001 stop:1114 length:114 start_codon:yes stop_codon:yes gene_type:complete
MIRNPKTCRKEIEKGIKKQDIGISSNDIDPLRKGDST